MYINLHVANIHWAVAEAKRKGKILKGQSKGKPQNVVDKKRTITIINNTDTDAIVIECQWWLRS